MNVSIPYSRPDRVVAISAPFEWHATRRFFAVGLVGASLGLVADMLLGWGVDDESLTGLERMLSSALAMSDARVFWSSFLGFVGIPLEGIALFGIYRLFVPRAPRHARVFRAGVFGYLIFAACGFHVMYLAWVYYCRQMAKYTPGNALSHSLRFAEYFLAPGIIATVVALLVLCAAQISAFARGLTPYPRWCWVFCLPVGMTAALALVLLGNHALVNALVAAWISIGALWMFGGLLAMSFRRR